VLTVKANFSPVPSTLDLKIWPSATTVCGTSSRFVQVTWVPAFTLSFAGEKLKLSIVISAVIAEAGAAPGATAGKAIQAIDIENAKPKSQSVFLPRGLHHFIISAPMFGKNLVKVSAYELIKSIVVASLRRAALPS
jgi:hypothetical protein